VDGQLKVTGRATFSAEYQLDNICYAALAYSTIAKGKITQLHTANAQAAAGVLAVITHETSPKLPKPPVFHGDGKGRGAAASPVPVLQDKDIYWNGQPIAVVVAETQEAAEYVRLYREVQGAGEIVQTLRENFERARTEAQVDKVRWSVLDQPYLEDKPNNKNYVRNVAVGAIAGIFIGSVWAVRRRPR
jgi:xanthine dehydrogenase YagR molybdenum-binding subunit